MTKVITKLSSKIKSELKKADEIWIAVALLNSSGLNLILDNLKENCKKNFLIGVDLPTDPKALRKLNKLQLTSGFKVRIHTDKQYFHPKLYLFHSQTGFTGFIGSANCTNGGLNSNIELSLMTTEKNTCLDLKKWFEKTYDIASPLTEQYLLNYQADYDIRMQRKKDDEKVTAKRKKELRIEIKATFIQRKELIKTLKSYRKDNDYQFLVNDRKKSVKEIKESIDYPDFDNINLNNFFNIPALGKLLHIPKPSIQRNIQDFKKLLLMLCDDRIDISVRYNLAFEKEYKMHGVSNSLISKILIIHNPNEYYVKNDKTNLALKKFGIDIPRGITKGDKYKITSKVLKEICKETGIANLAVLDYYLYEIGDEDV